jgi:hypothetical protein
MQRTPVAKLDPEKINRSDSKAVQGYMHDLDDIIQKRRQELALLQKSTGKKPKSHMVSPTSAPV